LLAPRQRCSNCALLSRLESDWTTNASLTCVPVICQAYKVIEGRKLTFGGTQLNVAKRQPRFRIAAMLRRWPAARPSLVTSSLPHKLPTPFSSMGFNRSLSTLSADSLSTIGKNFHLTGLTTLQTLNFARLTAVDTILWSALPELQNLTFASKVSRAANVLITNTQLNSLNGIDLQTVDSFNINNNPYLTSIDTQLGNITKALTIEANGRRLTASFPNLEWAYNMTFRNCSDVKLPSLTAVNGSMGFYENFFTSLAAPNLTTIGQSLVFDDNAQLTNISLPMLKQISGGYQIANNSALKVIDGFQALQVVAGALDFSGNFTK